MHLIFLIVNLLLLLYFAWGAIYQFCFSLAGLFYQPLRNIAFPAPSDIQAFKHIRVYIPAYREDAVILHSSREARKQQYPESRFEVEVIADQLQEGTLEALRKLGIKVTPVHFEKSTKSKALNFALQATSEEPDIAVILDADNIMAPDFLRRVNYHFHHGVQVLQGQRAAKNLQTGMAMLDAASEYANNHILCRGHRVLGLSARLAGSGMAFSYPLFKTAMAGIDVVGGFDKALEMYCTQHRIDMVYDELAIVYDEKVSASASFARQRSRWIAAQFDFAKQYIPKSLPALFQGNVDFFNKAIQMALPPRLLLPGLLFIGALINWIFGTSLAWFWTLAFVVNVASYLLALPSFVFSFKNLHLWLQIPVAFWATLKAMMRMKEARKKFIVTPKTVVHPNPDQT